MFVRHKRKYLGGLYDINDISWGERLGRNNEQKQEDVLSNWCPSQQQPFV